MEEDPARSYLLALGMTFVGAAVFAWLRGRARSVPLVIQYNKRDLPDVLIGRRMFDMPVLARDRVRFVGEKVGAYDSITGWEELDEVVLVDLPPEELLQRLKEGKVYIPQQAERAMQNFFRKGNLLALRELSLRRTADRVDEDVLAYRREQAVSTVWPMQDSVLVCVSASMKPVNITAHSAPEARPTRPRRMTSSTA